ncbi:MAG: helix-turn-helix domain-containing protein [Bacteroidaceae bacterium]|nr:helix-turn-helix domain-containing protein [Bacteroidaceae bacterium]
MKHLRYMVIFPLLLIMVSIVVGWRCYDKAKTEMVEDLNQALQRTTVADEGVDAMLDSLSCMYGNPMLTFNGTHHGFARFLRIPSLRDTAHISYSLAQVGGECNGGTTHARIVSDTITVAGCGADGRDVLLAVRAFANPSMASVFGHAGMTWPMASFFLGLMLLAFMLANGRLQNVVAGDAALRKDLLLTPMQQQLMDMFLASPGRTLSKEEICSALWPKKDNPDDSFYTFISRMKSSLSRQSSSFRIENKKGREYVLADEKGDFAQG